MAGGEKDTRGLSIAKRVLSNVLKDKDAKLLFCGEIDCEALKLPKSLRGIEDGIDLAAIHGRLVQGEENQWEGSPYNEPQDVLHDINGVWQASYLYSTLPKCGRLKKYVDEVKTKFEEQWVRAGLQLDEVEGDGEEDQDAQQEVNEMDDYQPEQSIPEAFSLFYDEQELPIRLLDDFTIFSASDPSLLIPLDKLSKEKSSACARGIVLMPDDKETLYAGDPECIGVQTEVILDWCLDYNDPPGIWIITPHAWYRLLMPSEDYAPKFSTTQRKFDFSVRASRGLTKAPRAGSRDMTIFMQAGGQAGTSRSSYAEGAVAQDATFISRQLTVLQQEGYFDSKGSKPSKEGPSGGLAYIRHLQLFVEGHAPLVEEAEEGVERASGGRKAKRVAMDEVELPTPTSTKRSRSVRSSEGLPSGRGKRGRGAPASNCLSWGTGRKTPGNQKVMDDYMKPSVVKRVEEDEEEEEEEGGGGADAWEAPSYPKGRRGGSKASRGANRGRADGQAYESLQALEQLQRSEGGDTQMDEFETDDEGETPSEKAWALDPISKAAAKRARDNERRRQRKQAELNQKLLREREVHRLRGRPPPPLQDFRVEPQLVPEVVMLWDFLQSFSPLLQLPPFSLRAFEAAICPGPFPQGVVPFREAGSGGSWGQDDKNEVTPTPAFNTKQPRGELASFPHSYGTRGRHGDTAHAPSHTVDAPKAAIHQSELATSEADAPPGMAEPLVGGQVRMNGEDSGSPAVVTDADGAASALVLRDIHAGLIRVIEISGSRAISAAANPPPPPSYASMVSDESRAERWQERLWRCIVHAHSELVTEEARAAGVKLETGDYTMLGTHERLAILRSLVELALNSEAMREHISARIEQVAAAKSRAAHGAGEEGENEGGAEGTTPTTDGTENSDSWVKWMEANRLGIRRPIGEDCDRRRYWALGGRAGAWRVFVEGHEGTQWGWYEGEALSQLLAWLEQGLEIEKEAPLLRTLRQVSWPMKGAQQGAQGHGREDESPPDGSAGTEAQYLPLELERKRPDGYRHLSAPLLRGEHNCKAGANLATCEDRVVQCVETLLASVDFWKQPGPWLLKHCQLQDSFRAARSFADQSRLLLELESALSEVGAMFQESWGTLWRDLWRRSVRQGLTSSREVALHLATLQNALISDPHSLHREAFMQLVHESRCPLYFPALGDLVVFLKTGCVLHLDKYLNPPPLQVNTEPTPTDMEDGAEGGEQGDAIETDGGDDGDQPGVPAETPEMDSPGDDGKGDVSDGEGDGRNPKSAAVVSTPPGRTLMSRAQTRTSGRRVPGRGRRGRRAASTIMDNIGDMGGDGVDEVAITRMVPPKISEETVAAFKKAVSAAAPELQAALDQVNKLNRVERFRVAAIAYRQYAVDDDDMAPETLKNEPLLAALNAHRTPCMWMLLQPLRYGSRSERGYMEVAVPIHVDVTLPDYIVPAEVFNKGKTKAWQVGDRFRMYFGGKAGTKISSGLWYKGTIMEVNMHIAPGEREYDPWECITVAWDYDDGSCQQKVNPWEIEVDPEEERRREEEKRREEEAAARAARAASWQRSRVGDSEGDEFGGHQETPPQGPHSIPVPSLSAPQLPIIAPQVPPAKPVTEAQTNWPPLAQQTFARMPVTAHRPTTSLPQGAIQYVQPAPGAQYPHQFNLAHFRPPEVKDNSGGPPGQLKLPNLSNLMSLAMVTGAAPGHFMQGVSQLQPRPQGANTLGNPPPVRPPTASTAGSTPPMRPLGPGPAATPPQMRPLAGNTVGPAATMPYSTATPFTFSFPSAGRPPTGMPPSTIPGFPYNLPPHLQQLSALLPMKMSTAMPTSGATPQAHPQAQPQVQVHMPPQAQLQTPTAAVQKLVVPHMAPVVPYTITPELLRGLPQQQEFRNLVINYMNRLKGRGRFKIPVFSGQELDLFKVFHEVQGRGGYEKVTRLKQWKDVCRCLGVDLKGQTSASYNMRINYEKCLLDFENYLSSGQYADDRATGNLPSFTEAPGDKDLSEEPASPEVAEPGPVMGTLQPMGALQGGNITSATPREQLQEPIWAYPQHVHHPAHPVMPAMLRPPPPYPAPNSSNTSSNPLPPSR